VLFKEVVMNAEVNEEEAWLHHLIKDFDYVVCSGKYGPLFYDLLSDQAKLVLNNMYNLEQRGWEISCPSQSDSWQVSQ